MICDQIEIPSIRQIRRRKFVVKSQNILNMERTLLESEESVIARCERTRTFLDHN